MGIRIPEGKLLLVAPKVNRKGMNRGMTRRLESVIGEKKRCHSSGDKRITVSEQDIMKGSVFALTLSKWLKFQFSGPVSITCSRSSRD